AGDHPRLPRASRPVADLATGRGRDRGAQERQVQGGGHARVAGPIGGPAGAGQLPPADVKTASFRHQRSPRLTFLRRPAGILLYFPSPLTILGTGGPGSRHRRFSFRRFGSAGYSSNDLAPS